MIRRLVLSCLYVLCLLPVWGCPEHMGPELVSRCASGLRLESGVTPPKAIYRLAPKARRVPGTNLFSCLEVTVKVDGSVTEVVIAERGDAQFDAAAAEAVQKWRYLPAHKDGKPIPLRMRVIVYNHRPPTFSH